MEFIEEHRELPIRDRCDVLVCGGGFAGISSALAAARLGKKVILLEKQYLLGGLGTAGLVTIYLPLCDGLGNQVSFGLAEELLRLSISLGAEDGYPSNWLDSNSPTGRTRNDPRFRVRYNPYIFAVLVEQLLRREGVTILYGCYGVDVVKQEERIQAVVIESISGRETIVASSVIDATGDACIAYLAGVPTKQYGRGNILAAWYYFLGESGYDLRVLGFSDVLPEDRKGQKTELSLKRRFLGLDCTEVSEMMQHAHDAILNDIINRRQNDPTIVPTSIPTTPQLRMTRRIVGKYELDESDMHQYFEDSIGMVSDWRKRGPIYEVPFSTLHSTKVKNLITAGRCASATDGMWDILRVIPCCAVTGQAAGTAAAMTDDFTTIDLIQLQKNLCENGVYLHEQDLPRFDTN